MPPRLLSINGEPTFLLGVNYWSRAGGPRMWERFDASVVRAELAQMRQLGLNVCRSFAFIPTFMPDPPGVDARALERFRSFLELCREEGVGTIPSFLVGHMSGENYDFPGQRGRSPYTDPEVLAWEQALARGVAGAAAGQPSVVAYLASNEMPYWGGTADPPTVTAWAGAIRGALHERDAARPFSLGDGVMNLKGGQNGFDPQALRGIIDFVGPHSYYADVDVLRQAYNAEFCLRSLSHLGLPVLFEEFGASSTQVSDANQALYYREVIQACLSVGAAGALGWCFSDFDLAHERPYLHHPFELLFGVTRADGSEKPVCQELRALAALARSLDYPRLEHPRPQTAIVVPSYFNTTYPFCSDDRDRMRRTLLQAYALAASAGLETELVPEGTPLAGYRLVLCPATQKLLASTWEALLEHAHAGNTVYWSYFAGDQSFQHQAWCHNFTELTGCRHLLRYACYDLPEEHAALEGAGLQLHACTTGGRPYPRAYLPIDPVRAEVLAHDERGRPALTRVAHGSGQAIFLNHPWEHYLAEQAGGTDDGAAFDLYRLLATRAALRPSVRASDGRVQLRVVRASDGADLLWVTNHAWQHVTTTIDSPGGAPVHGTEEQLSEGSCAVTLAPKQVAVYRLRG